MNEPPAEFWLGVIAKNFPKHKLFLNFWKQISFLFNFFQIQYNHIK